MTSIINRIFSKNALFVYARKTRALMSVVHRRRSAGIIFITFLSSVIEVIGLAFIIPVIYLINDPAPIYENRFIHAIYQAMGVDGESYFILIVMVALLVIFLIKNLFSILVNYLQANFSFHVATDIMLRQFNNFFDIEYVDVLEKNSNYFMRDIAIVPGEFAKRILLPFFLVVNELFVIMLIFTGLVLYNIEILLLLMVSIVPIVFILIRLTRKEIVRIGNTRNEVEPISFKHAFESIYNYVDIKLFNSIDYFNQRAISPFHKLYRTYVLLHIHQGLPGRIMEFIVVLTIALLYALVTFLLKGSPEQLVLTLALFATAAYRLMPSIDRILQSLISISSTDYVFKVIDEEKETDDGLADRFEPVSFDDKIEMRDVGYSYRNASKPALENIDLKIPKGSYVGIVGKSGSGKTTLVRLIVQLIGGHTGNITIDGNERFNAKEWYRLVSYVSQDFKLLDASLAENIAFGVPNDMIDHEKLMQSINMAQLDDVVALLKHGVYNTIGEEGSQLSGGQRQRIAVARALYKGAKLLALDEATSSLDVKTEGEIVDVISRLSEEGLTVVQVSHRLSALRNSDVIYEIADGRIVRKCAYLELVGENGEA